MLHALALIACASPLLAADPPKTTSAGSAAPPSQQARDHYEVTLQEIGDLKAVFATVRSKDLIGARSRTHGTLAILRVDEGTRVTAGQIVALVADEKIALKIRSLDAQILGIESRLKNAAVELERAEELRRRGVGTQVRVDQARTAYDVAMNEQKSAKAERSVLEEQIKEGEVLAPSDGLVLDVPFTTGSVVAQGESIATIAANEYLLRIELPERHARFTRVGDTVKVLGRGTDGVASEGRIVQVYPELKNGRVVADAEVAGLESYLVGERARVWIAAGKRKSLVVPRAFVSQKYGQDFVRLKRGDTTTDVVVQLGREAWLPGEQDTVEVLGGLMPNDVLVRP